MSQTDRFDADLGQLLQALVEVGFVISLADRLRLARVFEHTPGVRGHRGLRSLLGAILVKTEDDRERFDRVFAGFMERAEEVARTLGVDRARPDPQREQPRTPGSDDEDPRSAGPGHAQARKPGRALGTLAPVLVLAFLAAIALLFYHLVGPWTGPDAERDAGTPDARMHDAGVADAGTGGQKVQGDGIDWPDRPSACGPDALRGRSFPAPEPVLAVVDTPPPSPSSWPWFIAALGGLGLAVLLWFGLRRRHAMLVIDREIPEDAAPTRVYCKPETSTTLLSVATREDMVWGVGRFVSDEHTRRLDIAATVRDTARHGCVPHIRFQRAERLREIWLWVDESADNAAIAGLADEIETSLREYGLPVERAVFRGSPDTMVNAADGQVFTPREVEERRHGASVAILTDGAVFGELYNTRTHQPRMDALLRDLSHWPRLAMVDFSLAEKTREQRRQAGPSTLERVARIHDLTVLTPADLADYLSEGEGEHTRTRTVVIDQRTLERWAAVCALCPGPVHRDTAHALRERLDLPISSWAMTALEAHADSVDAGGYLSWSYRRRMDLVSWLRESEDQHTYRPDTRPRRAGTSLLEDALSFWLDTYKTQIDNYETRLEDKHHDQAALHQLELERALLVLWRDPSEAARVLSPLHRGRHQVHIENELDGLACADENTFRGTRLLWRREDWPQAYLALRAMGMEKHGLTMRLARPARLWAGAVLCAAAALGLTLAALTRPAPPVLDCAVPALDRQDAWARTVALDDGMCLVEVETPHTRTRERVTRGTVLTVASWQEREVACVERVVERGQEGEVEGEVWRCGAADQGPASGATNGRPVVVIEPYVDPAPDEGRTWRAEDLALALIECNEADLVYLGTKESWEGYQGQDADPFASQDAARVVGGDAIADELHRLHGDGCGSGIQLVDIPSGTFWMGTRDEDQDPGEYPDEKPARRVTIGDPDDSERPAFSMGKCEVTNRQYQGYLEAARTSEKRDRLEVPLWADDERFNQLDQPVSGVSWHAAQAYCAHFGMRLPTEAEWEYACRGEEADARERRVWPFEGGESRLAAHAWFAKDRDSGTRVVGTKDPTSHGLYDMHGNVWEWVQDWYADSYPAPGAEPDDNPPGPVDGTLRVLRGGSFGYSTRDLRCAFRGGPSFRIRIIGFRCVRGSGRQP